MGESKLVAVKQEIESPLNQIGRWRFPDKKFIYEKTVLIKQTNLLGNTYFSNFIEWQGEAREKLFLTHPAALAFIKEYPNILLVTHTLHHRFLSNAYLGDTIRIELTTGDIMDHSFKIMFRYYSSSDGVLIGEGWQKICFLDTNVNRPCKTPQIFLDLALPIQEHQKTDLN